MSSTSAFRVFQLIGPSLWAPLILVFVYFFVSRFSACEGVDARPHVFLTVSSLASYDYRLKKQTHRELEINWYDLPKEFAEGDGVYTALYDVDPTQQRAAPLDKTTVEDFPEGFYKTIVEFPRPVFRPVGLNSQCLGYWGALHKGNGTILASACLRTQPRWMEEIKESIKGKTLSDLLIPGTHNSGTYEHYNHSTYTIFTKYQVCQEESIWSQLVYGIRFLDIRVSHQSVKGRKEMFWVSHGMFRMDSTINEVLSDVKKFLNSTREFVVLDLHRFNNGFNKLVREKVHSQLMKLIEDELGEYIIPRSLGIQTKLEKLWELNKRLYVGYADREGFKNGNFHDGVRHLWADTDKWDGLRDFMDSRLCFHYGLSSAMVELTPKASGIIFNSYGGLRKLADLVNRLVTKEYREKWAKCGHIVASDFFLGNDLVSVAIDYNRKLGG